MIQLGAKAKDVITGFSGVVTGRVVYITGCNQLLINPGVDKDGKLQGSEWIDEQRMQQVGDAVIALENGVTPGPDRPAPIR